MSEIDPHFLHMIGITIFVLILGGGVTLSAWKGEFGKKQYYCTSCCNPSHWSPEDRAKFEAEQKKERLNIN